tara:strand:- start:31 stop:162 length:132 start_codon:yes stop_codon:yes gene_type:complete
LHDDDDHVVEIARMVKAKACRSLRAALFSPQWSAKHRGDDLAT